MTSAEKNTLKNSSPKEALEHLYLELIKSNPYLTKAFAEGNAGEQKDLFLSDQTRNPEHVHPKLDSIDFDSEYQSITDLEQDLEDLFHDDNDATLNNKHLAVYNNVASTYKKKLRMIELVREMERDPGNRVVLESEYMQLNGEVYGLPDEEVYRSLLSESLTNIAGMELKGQAATIRDELFALAVFDKGNAPIANRFKPSPETIEWMKGVVESLYEGMLSHVPGDADIFSPDDIKAIFEDIIRFEFTDTDEYGNIVNSAEGWSVELIDGSGPVSVRSTEKKIVIPKNKKPISSEQLKDLIVHELGVHLLRSIMGEETDLYALAHSLGVQSSIDADESLGKIMEQARKGQYEEAGIGHYITIGAAYFDQMDFRDTFELKWRLKLLESLDGDGQELDDKAINDAKEFAYTNTARVFQGPDNLPLFKDLSYHRAMDMWAYLESIRGDDLKFLFVLMGKQNPADIDHERIVYETRTR